MIHNSILAFHLIMIVGYRIPDHVLGDGFIMGKGEEASSRQDGSTIGEERENGDAMPEEI